MIKSTNNTNALYLLQVSINCIGHGDGTVISPRGHSSESFVPVMHYHAQELLSCMIFFFQVFSQWFKACLHGGVGPQVREVTCLRWGNPPDHIISHFNLITFTWWVGDPPHVTSPIWGPPPLCKQYPWAYETCLYYLIICIQLCINILIFLTKVNRLPSKDGNDPYMPLCLR